MAGWVHGQWVGAWVRGEWLGGERLAGSWLAGCVHIHTYMLIYIHPLACAGPGLGGREQPTKQTTTHSHVQGLVVASNDAAQGVVTLVGPPDANIAVPQVYLLFLLNGDVYSAGEWVTVPPPSN